jgi:hypothetical protein
MERPFHPFRSQGSRFPVTHGTHAICVSCMEEKLSNRPAHVHLDLRFGERVQSMKSVRGMFWYIKTEEFVRRERRRIGGRDEYFI